MTCVSISATTTTSGTPSNHRMTGIASSFRSVRQLVLGSIVPLFPPVPLFCKMFACAAELTSSIRAILKNASVEILYSTKMGGLGGRPTPVLAHRCMIVRDGHAMMRKPLSPRRGVFFGCKTVDAKRQQTISEYSNFPIRNGPVILRSGRGCKHHMIL